MNMIKVDKLSRLNVASVDGEIDRQKIAEALKEIGITLVNRVTNKSSAEHQVHGEAKVYVVNDSDDKFLGGIDYLTAVSSRRGRATNTAAPSVKADMIEKLVVSGVMTREQAIKFLGN